MTTTMSMRERHKRVEELVMQDPLVCERANEFNDAQREINEWHVRNSPTAHATMGQLAELDELITFSEFCLEDLKCAKTAAYNQLMSQYPHVWDTTCADPFNTGTQDDATDTGAETEEMEEVPTPTTLIHADKLVDILDREQAIYETTIGFYTMCGLDTSSLRGRLETVSGIRTQIKQLIDQAKETHNASH